MDKTITLNKGGASGTAQNAGVMFEENSNVAGYILVSPTDDGFVFKAPTGCNTFTLSLTSNIAFNSAVFISPATSNVGFGSARQPLYNVHIQNSNTPTLYIETLSNDAVNVVFANTDNSWIWSGPVSSSNNALQLSHQSNVGGTSSSSTVITVSDTGNVGFGTDSPQYAIDVVGSLNVTGQVLVNGQQMASGGAVAGGGGGGVGWGYQSTNIYSDSNVGIKTHVPRYDLDVNGIVNATSFYQNGTPFTSGYWTSCDGFMFTLSNLGINQATPVYTLDVGGTINAQNILVNGSSIASGFWQMNAGNIFSLSNVGVGTAIPSKMLDVVGDARVTGNLSTTQTLTTTTLAVTGNTTMTGTLGITGAQKITSLTWGDGIIFNNGQDRLYADTGLKSIVLNIDTSSNFTLSVGQTPALYVSSNGSVGVANSNPHYALDVSGTVNATNYVNVPWSGIVSKPAFCNVAVSANYSDLRNTPSLCNVATTANYLDLRNTPALCNIATTARYTDLTNTPALCNIATTGNYTDLNNKPALCNIATTGAWGDLSGIPAGLSGIAQNDLSNFTSNVIFQNKVGIANSSPAYALDVIGAINASSYCNVNFANLINAPSLCNVATTGKFTDLTGISPLSYFTNDISYFGCNVGIKITSPQFTLHVGGTIYATSYCNLDWSMVQNAPNFARPSYSNLVDAPLSLSELNNDLGTFGCNVGFGGNETPAYAVDVTGAVNATTYCNVDYENLVNKPALCNLATTASWNDVAHKPTLSELVNDLTFFSCNVGILVDTPAYPLHVNGNIYATGYCNFSWSFITDRPSLCNVATTGRYQDLTETPSHLTQFTNDLSNFSCDTTFVGQVQANSLTVTGTIIASSYSNIDWSMINNPPPFTNSYYLLSNVPAFCNVSLTARYSDLQGVPTLCNVATEGSYASLSDTPNLSIMAYFGSNSYTNLLDTPSFAAVALSGNYSDLDNVPVNLSSFCNDLTEFGTITSDGDATINGNLYLQGALTSSNVALFTSNVEVDGTLSVKTVTAPSNISVMNIGCTSNVTTINIGNNSKNTGHLINIGTTSAPGGSNVISIGGPTDTVYIPGGLVYVYESFLYTSNHTFTLNEGGVVGSAAGAGILVEENGAVDSYLKVSDDLNGWVCSAPNSTSDTTFDMSGNQLTINNTITIDTDSACVGVGTTTPLDKLHVQGGNIRLHNPTNITGQSNSIILGHVNSSTFVALESYFTSSSNQVDLRMYSYASGALTQTMTLTKGRVGVCTDSPTVALHVSGDISVNKTLHYRNELAATYPNGTTMLVDVPSIGQVNYHVPNTTNSNAVLTLLQSGNVGVGSTSPRDVLDVAGNVLATGMFSTNGLSVYDMSSTTNGSPSFGIGYNTSCNVQLSGPSGLTLTTASFGSVFLNTPYVGIGTSSPQQQLHVIGNILASSSITSSTLVSGDATFSNVTACNVIAMSNSLLAVSQTAEAASNHAYSSLWVVPTGQTATFTSGSVGIGTTNPAYALDVAGTIQATSYCNISWNMLSGIPSFSLLAYSGSNTYNNITGTPALCNIALSGAWSDVNGKPAFASVATSGLYSDLAGKPSTLSNFTNNLTYFPGQMTFCNKVGIKTDTPTWDLDVNGTINASNILIQGQPLASVIPVTGYWQYNTAYEYCMSNVGVGLTNPQTLLSVGNDFSITACNASWNTLVGKGLYMRYSTNGGQDSAYIQSVDRSASKYYNMSIEGSNIRIGQSNLSQPAIYVGYSGYVGVGNSSPSCALEVTGTVKATNFTGVNYNSLINVPTFATVATSGSYTDLTSRPTYATVATSGRYTDLTSLPTYAQVATTGSYNDLSNLPYTLTAFSNNLTSFSNAITFGSNIKFTNATNNRTVVLYDTQSTSNNNQYTGIGVNTNGLMRYQVTDLTVDHVFYAGSNATTSVELMRVKGSGSVGIGTTSPAAGTRLHISNGNMQLDGTLAPTLCVASTSTNASNAGEIQLLQSGQANGWKVRNVAQSNALNFVQLSNAAESSCLWVSTNIGIKKTNPIYDLDVNGTVNASSYCNITWAMLNGIPNFGSLAYAGSNLYSNLSGTPTNLTQFTNDLSSFTATNVTFSGNVGVGVISPSVKLDVNGAINCSSINISSSNMTIQNINSGASGTIFMGSDTSTTAVSMGNGTNVSTVNIATNTNSTTTINMGSTNDTLNVQGTSMSLGVGTLATTSALLTLNSSGALLSGGSCGFQVYESSNAMAYIMTSADRSSFLFKTPAGNQMAMDLTNNGIKFNTNALVVLSSGNVGIGTTSPSQTLEVAGNVKCASVITTSDANLKENIVPMTDSLAKILQIEGVYFDWKTKNTEQGIQGNLGNEHPHNCRNAGVLAQQVQKVLPGAVHESDSGKGVDYSALVALCISAIKEQQVLIDDLKCTIARQ